jgi:hypothetical protein
VIGELVGVQNGKLKPGKVEREEDAPALLQHQPGNLDVVVAVDANDAWCGPLDHAKDDGNQRSGGKQAIIGSACQRTERNEMAWTRAGGVRNRQSSYPSA